MSPDEKAQVDVIVENVQESIAQWLDEQAKKHSDWFAAYGLPGNETRAHHYHDAAKGIRTGEWRK